ncbi:MAG: hypothetical protein IANPNBLG_01167 [Bryobacteraceae bacterium]|nr:hypothetical protein [Bryobacteraceae bacterium]
MVYSSHSLVSGHHKLLLLAPSFNDADKSGFRDVIHNGDLHEMLLADIQRLRGEVYLRDGAISASQLTADGRHVTKADAMSWHIISLNEFGKVRGCYRHLKHHATIRYEQMMLSKSPLAQSLEWGGTCRSVVESLLEEAKTSNLSCAEVGGWAVAGELRHTSEALRIALTGYALGDLLGGCMGFGTVTRRNCSAVILQRIGARRLRSGDVELPSYFDPGYRCEMEILRFDSRELNPKYASLRDEIRAHLAALPVVCGGVSFIHLHEVLARETKTPLASRHAA